MTEKYWPTPEPAVQPGVPNRVLAVSTPGQLPVRARRGGGEFDDVVVLVIAPVTRWGHDHP